jgi:hypothetical protein
MEKGHFSKPTSENEDTSRRLTEYRIWLTKQYVDFKIELCNMAALSNTKMSVPAIRTMIECIRSEALISSESSFQPNDSFYRLIDAVLKGSDVDVDILLMLKDEVSCHDKVIVLYMYCDNSKYYSYVCIISYCSKYRISYTHSSIMYV